MAPIDYFKTALYGEGESNYFLPDVADFFGSYDDIARKLQAKRDEEEQEYKDLLAQAAQPRTTSTGELLSQALLSFGAPLLGKAVGGVELGAQAGEVGLKASAALSSEIDERYKLQQAEKALRAKAAGERVDEFDKEILKLPLAKLDRQGQMIANRMQAEDTFVRQAALQEQRQAFEKEMEGVRHGNRLAEIGAYSKRGETLSRDETEQLIANQKQKAVIAGQEYTPERETSDRLLLKYKGPEGLETLRRETSNIEGLQRAFTFNQDGAEQLTSIDPATRTKMMAFKTLTGRVLSTSRAMKAANEKGDFTLENALGTALYASMKEWVNAGAALTGIEASNLMNSVPVPSFITDPVKYSKQTLMGLKTGPMLDALETSVLTTAEGAFSQLPIKIHDRDKFFGIGDSQQDTISQIRSEMARMRAEMAGQ